MVPMSDPLLRPAEVKQRLAVSHDKLYALLRTGELPSLKIGRSRRIPESAVTAFIAERLNSTGNAA